MAACSHKLRPIWACRGRHCTAGWTATASSATDDALVASHFVGLAVCRIGMRLHARGRRTGDVVDALVAAVGGNTGGDLDPCAAADLPGAPVVRAGAFAVPCTGRQRG